MKYFALVNSELSRTWSGTTMSLFNAFSKQVETKSVFFPHVESKIAKIPYVMNNLICTGSIEKDLNFNVSYQRFIEKKFAKEIEDDFIFQIGDLCKAKNSGIYSDLSISMLIYYKQNYEELYRFSGFQNLSLDSMKRRDEIQRQRYESAKYIFTMSENMRDFLINKDGYSAEKVIHIGGGVNLELDENSNIIKNRKRILFVGRDFYRKGGDFLVSTFQRMKEEDPDLELYIAGPQSIDEKFLTDGVFFLGDLSKPKLREYFEKCDIFCMPSRFEAYGLVFIEALSMGLPCIATDSFEMKNFVRDGENGYLVSSTFNEADLSRKIKDLLRNEAVFSLVNKNKSKYIEQYSWDSVSHRAVDAINKGS